ncbi:plastocyanin/azurin family copper-binding protein [Maribellus mangrovi]|uniref:plastocyanin/azurin family copper-binding protein n=1 Tax=Maribellus mangrovi TaxID=3133146 RepID=UPI0030EE9126
MKRFKAFGLTLLFMLVSISIWAQREIKIEGHDNLRFTVETIKASPGEKLKITLKTVSNMDKSQMAHNWVLLKQGTDALNFVTKGLQHAKNDYIDPSLESKIIAHTDMLGGGETDSIVITVPETKGTYEYICTFRAHYQAGMKGRLIVG